MFNTVTWCTYTGPSALVFHGIYKTRASKLALTSLRSVNIANAPSLY